MKSLAYTHLLCIGFIDRHPPVQSGRYLSRAFYIPAPQMVPNIYKFSTEPCFLKGCLRLGDGISRPKLKRVSSVSLHPLPSVWNRSSSLLVVNASGESSGWFLPQNGHRLQSLQSTMGNDWLVTRVFPILGETQGIEHQEGTTTTGPTDHHCHHYSFQPTLGKWGFERRCGFWKLKFPWSCAEPIFFANHISAF